MPRATSQTASIVSRPMGVPVGLLGVQRKTMSGSSRSTAATAVAGLRVNSSSRSAVTHSVPVLEAMIECIE